MRPDGGKVLPAGVMPPGQRKAGPPLSSGSPTMQSSPVVLVSSNPCVLGWKSGTAPKSTGSDGCTDSVQGLRSRPSAESGTSRRGTKPSLERMTSVASEEPACTGEKETWMSTLDPGSPTDALEGVTDQAGSLEATEMPLSESGAIWCGSSPTLLMVTLAVRVVPVAVAPT